MRTLSANARWGWRRPPQPPRRQKVTVSREDRRRVEAIRSKLSRSRRVTPADLATGLRKDVRQDTTAIARKVSCSRRARCYNRCHDQPGSCSGLLRMGYVGSRIRSSNKTELQRISAGLAPAGSQLTGYQPPTTIFLLSVGLAPTGERFFGCGSWISRASAGTSPAESRTSVRAALAVAGQLLPRRGKPGGSRARFC
jgi:hypothetical protein